MSSDKSAMPLRKRIFYWVECPDSENVENNTFDPYDFIMLVTIVVSVVPLAFKETYFCFEIIDKVTVTIFIFDYILRLLTADFKLNKGVASFFLYPFTPLAIFDLLAILPSLSFISGGFRLLKLVRLLRTLRVLRVFKAVRHSRNIRMIISVVKKTKESLLIVVGIASIYVLISALIVFNVEPDTFNNYFDAVYWATVSLTTMGYGDIYPVTIAGRIVTMVSAFVGIAIVALPAGIITSGMMEEINRVKDSDKEILENGTQEKKETGD